MASDFVIDTHPLIWFAQDDPRLGINARAAMGNLANRLFVPAIALAEACWIIERGRTSVPTPAALLAVLDRDPRIRVVPMDDAIVRATIGMAAVKEMHDRQIIATALTLIQAGHAVTLVTRDANMVASGLVPVLW